MSQVCYCPHKGEYWSPPSVTAVRPLRLVPAGALDQSPRAALPDGLAGSDEAIEAAAKAEYEHCRDVEETEWERGRWERLEPAHRERYLRAAHRAVTAAEPFIAARVRAEAVVEHRADLQHRIEVSTRYENDRRVALAERDEYHRNWQEAEKRTGEAVAEAVAEERQRIIGEFAKAARVAHKGDGETDAQRLFEVAKRVKGGYPVGGSSTTETVARLLRFVAGFISAAGSVPVATPLDDAPPVPCAYCNRPSVGTARPLARDDHGQRVRSCGGFYHGLDYRPDPPVPVATPAERCGGPTQASSRGGFRRQRGPCCRGR